MGYVTFEVTGGYPEKFINLSVKNNINFWNLKRIGADFKAQIKASEYKNLHSLARLSNSRVRLCTKHGLPFFVFKYRKRWGVLVGAVMFIVVLYCFSLYIWNINIVGNNELGKDEILGVLDSSGLSVGTLKSRVVPSDIEEFTMARLGKISWMSVNIKGSRANIEIKEKIEKPEILKKGELCNIVATQDGQIERLETYNGAPMVMAGDVVTKGQLLISGVNESPDFKSEFSGAEGKVFARTKENIIERIPLHYIKAEDTGKVLKNFRVKLFGLEIPLWSWSRGDENFRKEIFIDSCNFLGIDLPIKIYKEFLYEQKMSDCNLDLEGARMRAEENVREREKNQFKDATVLERGVKETKTEDEYILDVVYNCIKDIGRQEAMSFE